MPQPAEVGQVADRLVARYQQAMAEWQALIESTASQSPERRLRSLLAGVDRIFDGLDVDVRGLITATTPQVWVQGATSVTGTPISTSFTQANLAAIQAMAAQNYGELLDATGFVRSDTKRVLRTMARAGALDTLGGQTASRAGLTQVNARQDGFAKPMTVTYANGAEHSLADWADTAVRTQTAKAYNAGTLGTCRAFGVKWVEIADGPACIMPGETFMPYGSLEGLSRAWFAGPALTLVAAHPKTGTRRVTVGPNHPMLTREGWKTADLITERDQLVYDERFENPLHLPELDFEEVPAVEDTFAALHRDGVAVARVRRDDLHGDGAFCENEIEVVGPVWELLVVTDPRFVEHRSELDLVGSDTALQSVSSDSGAFAFFDGDIAESGRVVGGGDLVGPLIVGGVGPLPRREARRATEPISTSAGAFGAHGAAPLARERRPRTATSGQACVGAETTGRVVAGVEGAPARLTDRGSGVAALVELAHEVTFVDVVAVETRHYEGWVFDASCSEQMFACSGFVVKNCGLTAHDDPELANGLVVPIETAEAYPVAHPRCARSILPRADLDDEEAAKAHNDARDMDALNAEALAERQRAAQRTVTGRRMTVKSERVRVERRARAGRTARTPR